MKNRQIQLNFFNPPEVYMVMEKSEDDDPKVTLFSSKTAAFQYAHDAWLEILDDRGLMAEANNPTWNPEDEIINVNKNFRNRETPAYAYLTEVAWDSVSVELHRIYD